MKTFVFHIEKLDMTDLGCEYVTATSKEEARSIIHKKYPSCIISGGQEV